jgi:phage shock protein PspC (stress-responsive transcriptional regulator)
MSVHPSAAGYRSRMRHTPPRRGQGFLGATASLAIVGTFVLYYTNAFASRCREASKPRIQQAVCSGMAGLAHHLQLPVTIAVIAFVAVFAATFVWSLLWA